MRELLPRVSSDYSGGWSPDRRSHIAGRILLRAKLFFIVRSESIHPANAISGGLELPGDKSISHRYAMLAALADGTSELRNFAAARDCHSTLGCMKALGGG